MNSVSKAAVHLLLNYVSNNPMEKIPIMFELAEKLDRGNLHAGQISTMRQILLDENSVWRTFVEAVVREVDTKLLKKVVECFFVNSTWRGKSGPAP